MLIRHTPSDTSRFFSFLYLVGISKCIRSKQLDHFVALKISCILAFVWICWPFSCIANKIAMHFSAFFLIIALYGVIVSAKVPIAPNNFDQFDSRMEKSTKLTNYRLPNNTKPNSYDIKIVTMVHQGEFGFTGKITINLQTLEDTKVITLHKRQLAIGNIELRDTQGDTFDLDAYEYDNVTEFLKIIPSNNVTLEKDKTFLLSIDYTGELRTDQKGFYRSSYVDANGTTK